MLPFYNIDWWLDNKFLSFCLHNKNNKNNKNN